LHYINLHVVELAGYNTIKIYLRALKSWRYGQLSLARGTKTEN